MIFSRTLGSQVTVVAVNFTDTDAHVPFSFPAGGTWREHLGESNVDAMTAVPISLTIPSNYGRVWTIN
jgi:hypothetical protein